MRPALAHHSVASARLLWVSCLMLTPMHAALGLEPGVDLMFEHVTQSVAEEVSESAELDWKRDLPLAATGAAKIEVTQELAKDLAAMANSGGGMLVYGVAEKSSSGVSVAAEVRPVGIVTEELQRRIRQVASYQISPPLLGLQLLPLAPDHEPANGVLAVVVPDSPDRPHLVPRGTGDQFWFVAPRRSGPHTDAMSEYELATAYRQREQSRRTAERDLQELFEYFADAVGADTKGGSPWVIAVARPTTPLRRNRLTYEQGQRLLNGSTSATTLSPLTETHGKGLDRGLRTYFVAAERGPTFLPPGSTVAARVQVFDDGSVGAALRRGTEGNNILGGAVAITDIEMVALDLFILMSRVASLLKVASDYQTLLNIRPGTEIFLHHEPAPSGHLQHPRKADRRPGYRAVEGLVLNSEGMQAAAASHLDAVVDAVEQAGGSINLTWEELLSPHVASF